MNHSKNIGNDGRLYDGDKYEENREVRRKMLNKCARVRTKYKEGTKPK